MKKSDKAATGFEPVNGGFADLSLSHLGTPPRLGCCGAEPSDLPRLSPDCNTLLMTCSQERNSPPLWSRLKF